MDIAVSPNTSRVTLKDIAEKTGLSVSTVSQILTNNKRNYSSEQTRLLIKKTAAALGYRPNLGHKLLKGESLRMASVLISTAAARRQGHIRELILLLSEQFKRLDYSINLQTMDADPFCNLETVHSMIDRGCDTFIFIGSPFGMDAIEDLLVRRHLNYIAYNSNCRRQVRVSTSSGVKEIVKNYISSGLKNLFIANRNADFDQPESRIKAFVDAMGGESAKERIYLFDNALYSGDDFDRSYFEQGYEVTSRILTQHPEADGIIYLSDIYALGGAKYIAEETSMRIGTDIVLAGFNNTPAVRFSPFQITTGQHPVSKIVDAIIENAFSDKEVDIVFTPEIIYNNDYHIDFNR